METQKTKWSQTRFIHFFYRDACQNAGIFFKFCFIFLILTHPMENTLAQDYNSERNIMVRNQVKGRGIKSAAVLSAMRKVPRHKFVPLNMAPLAYSDRPLSIGHEQTISQPFIVAYMSETLDLKPGSKVLEIGTGSGYQAAVLAEMGMEVWSIEIIPELAMQAEKNLQNAGIYNVSVKCGNGYKGWPEEAPFDAVIITAAPKSIPRDLVQQMKVGGVMVVPVGPVDSVQSLKKVTKKEEGITQTTLLPVRFVPMVKSYL
jgi:protein-L-isoaspartate(D-aspartate) O-methyltransferase